MLLSFLENKLNIISPARFYLSYKRLLYLPTTYMYAELKPAVTRPWAMLSFPINRKALARGFLAFGIRLALYRLSLDLVLLCLQSTLGLTNYWLRLATDFLCFILRCIFLFLEDVSKMFSLAEISYLFAIAAILLAFPFIYRMASRVGQRFVNPCLRVC